MQTVVLIGDSIRMGYQEAARRELAGQAEVWAPEENGGTSRNVLSHLDEWAVSRRPDVVHVNCGLHDIRREFGAREAAVPLDQYRSNIREILRRLSRETEAQVIWAATTPVNQQWHHDTKGFDRFEADVVACNRAASEEAAELGIPVNDLFALVAEAGRDSYLSQDGVHFTAEGSELLGKAVARFIERYLSPP